nr:uncharacterized protein LOC129136504 isoform X2 [Pan troglodytes]
MRRCIHVILQEEFSTSFEQPRFSHHLQIMEDTGCRQSPRSHGQPFRKLRSHWQAPRLGWPAQEGGGRRPSRGEEAAAVAGGGSAQPEDCEDGEDAPRPGRKETGTRQVATAEESFLEIPKAQCCVEDSEKENSFRYLGFPRWSNLQKVHCHFHQGH